MPKLLFDDNDWSFPKLEKALHACEEIAVNELKLDCYPNQLEIINASQMLDAYSTSALPVMYRHWSFGKSLIRETQTYQKGYSNLAFEVVINSSPCISYLMEENSMTMQTLVIAHAAFGHNHFFKNNAMFREWTDAGAIIDYLDFAKKYISSCEERYGYEEVEVILDACHALMNLGIDKYKRSRKVSMREEQIRQEERQHFVEKNTSEFWDKVLVKNKKKKVKETFQQEENLLYFIEKNSPLLKGWQREIVRIVRKVSQYFYPQIQTKVANEGFASFTHYYIINRLWETGQLSEGSMLEFIHSHSSVLFQPTYNDKRYYGINPYALGFDILQDIKRICDSPTDEDKEWFPDLAGANWLDEILYAVENFKDESFILQYLSPNTMRKWKMFNIVDYDDADDLLINKIHDERGYKKIRKSLSLQYNTMNYSPDIQVVNVNDKTLELEHKQYSTALDEKSTMATLRHLKTLWGNKIILDSINPNTNRIVKEYIIE